MDKKITLVIVTGFIAATVLALDLGKQDPVMPDRYCVELKDGKTIVMQDNKPITAEVTLNDGSKLTPAGIVIKKNAAVITLKTGDCIDKEGSINNAAAPQAPIGKKTTNK